MWGWFGGGDVFLAFYAISNISRKTNSGNKKIIFFLEKQFLGPLDLLPWRVIGPSVGPSVRPSTPVTRQPIFGSFSKSVGIFLG